MSDIQKDKFNLISSGCGTGKSHFIAKNLLSKLPDVNANEVLFITSRKITQEQQLNEYYEYLSKFYVYDGETVQQLNGALGEDINYELSNIFIMTYDKLIYALDRCNSVDHRSLQKVKVVIFDECHTLFSDTFIDNIGTLKVWIRTSTYMNDKIFIGLTATPGIVYHSVKYWGVGVNNLTDSINIRYRAEKLTLTSYDALPYLFSRGVIRGKSIILCYSVKECFHLQSKINNSAVLISKHNSSYTSDMDLIYDHIINNSCLPETFIDNSGNAVPLKVLIATSTLREGVNLNPDSKVENVICCLPDELHITQFMGRCRFDIKNLIVTRERRKRTYNIERYLVANKEAFYRYLKDETDDTWFNSIKHLLQDECNINRIAVDLSSFKQYLSNHWIDIKIVTESQRREIQDIAAGAGIIDYQKSKITFNKAIRFIQSLGFEVHSGRCITNGKKNTYKAITKGVTS